MAGYNPKPVELTLSRANFGESQEEARTGHCCKNVGCLEVRGNMPIETGDSWFSPKYI